MKRILKVRALATVVAMAIGTVVALATPASAATAPCVQIYRIVYNSLGVDNRSNISLNGEWIQLYNRCTVANGLAAVRIKDAVGHTYTFSAYTLGAHRYVRVHTGRGTNTAADRYWGLGGYVWNNDKDTAYVYNRHNVLIDKCSYNNTRVSAIYC
jgi:lamin tail-like protein